MEQPDLIKDKKYLTPFNVITAPIMLVGLVLTVLRFTQGLGAVTNLDHNYPWGLWIGFDVATGVALAAGGFVMGATVYLFGMEKYHAVVRPAVLTGFLGYVLVVVGLHYDLGRPWRLPYPIVVSHGFTSVMFFVGWCVLLYLACQFVELFPVFFEWLNWKKWRKVAISLTIGSTIFGVLLSTLHQSGLGALFLIAPSKLHPLWYSQFLPLFFFISAIVAGISMVIFEGAISHKVFAYQVDEHHNEQFDYITLGLAKAGSVALATYFAAKVLGIAYDHNWHYLFTPYGHWFLFEMLGFVLLPCVLYAVGFRNKNLKLIRVTSLIAVLGIVLNRLNVSIFVFNWTLPQSEKYWPSWMEITITVSIVLAGVWVFRWMVNRMPILFEHPEYKDAH